MGYVAELLVWLAGHSQLLAHQLLWNMQTNLYRDEDARIEDPELFEPLKDVINKVHWLTYQHSGVSVYFFQ